MGDSNYNWNKNRVDIVIGNTWRKAMEKFDTGAARSSRMPRYDLIPRVALERLAKRFTGEVIGPHEGDKWATGGALKYGECNWEKGLPTSDVINHIFDHLTRYVNRFRECLKGYNGDMTLVRQEMQSNTKDDDLGGAMWGLAVLMHQEETGMFHDNNYEAPQTKSIPPEACLIGLEQTTSEAKVMGEAIDKANKRLDLGLSGGSWVDAKLEDAFKDDKFLPEICSLCNIGDADAKINHAFNMHGAKYNMARKTITYPNPKHGTIALSGKFFEG